MIDVKRCVLLLSVLFSCAAVCAARPQSISKVEAELYQVSPPEVDFKQVGGTLFTKTEPDNRWLMIRISFHMPKHKNTPPEYRETGGRRQIFYYGYLDDVDLSVRVLFDTGFKVNGQAIYGVFTGKTRFRHIKCDGRKHQAFMFVPARVIDRYSQLSDGATRKAGKSDFKVEAVFSAGGRDLGRAYCNVSNREAFEKAMRTVPENLRIAGGVLPRSQTPWALLNYDSFDQEKEVSVSERD